MADTSIILNRIRSHGLFSRSDLRIAMEECGYQTSEGITNHMITRLLDAGGIVRVGRNRYCVADSLKTYHFPHSEFAVSVADEITEAHPYLDFRIFELVQRNEFVNHQIAHNIVFVSVEGELEKMLVDIAVDKLLRKVVYSGEYPAIYQGGFSKYAIDKNVMFRYARRRGALGKYKEFLVNEAGLRQEDLGI